ncbi:hypothetical protein PTSG_03076 [Salpingoeca rosetta]|uniref:rRNA adenine N(6)-methyltransferase n=1 Tax=Salpingoeca rosetta (strain ATCC 50818 / BSB-021) TaxID=946362 RepID=F2U465_SALR5|nr:uncharacterized protein PTSG_03076 [Salpingoeca rosetta]EGD82431.1 hypothetical protein PTSG_03076 [Salpingoeca rosetta]|eukprot:XP_004995667.1 hypothetical protein PTSG_03076 [Salpingoeca rosetta]
MKGGKAAMRLHSHLMMQARNAASCGHGHTHKHWFGGALPIARHQHTISCRCDMAHLRQNAAFSTATIAWRARPPSAPADGNDKASTTRPGRRRARSKNGGMPDSDPITTAGGVKLPQIPAHMQQPEFAKAMLALANQEEEEEEKKTAELEHKARKADQQAPGLADPSAGHDPANSGTQGPSAVEADRAGTANTTTQQQMKEKQRRIQTGEEQSAGELDGDNDASHSQPVNVVPVCDRRIPLVINSAQDIPTPPEGPLSSIPLPDIPAILKSFQMRNNSKANRPHTASLRRFAITNYGIADAFASLIPGLDKLHIVESNPYTMLFTRALLNHGAKSVTIVTNTGDRQNKHLHPQVHAFQEALGEKRVKLVHGDMQKLDLPDGCPPSEVLFDDFPSRQWLVRSSFALAGQTNAVSGSVFIFNLLYKVAMRSGPFHWGRTAMYFTLPRYLTQHIFSTGSRLGVLAQVLCHVNELAAVSRDLFSPRLKCTEGPGAITVHFVELIPRYSPLIPNYETFVVLDFLLRHLTMTAKTIGKAMRGLGPQFTPLFAMTNINPETPLKKMKVTQYVDLAVALHQWEDRPISAQAAVVGGDGATW